jgi:CubicO group peptidase (beta-lactamase class C family)
VGYARTIIGVADSAFQRTVDVFADILAGQPGAGGQLTIRSAASILVSLSGGDDGHGDRWTPRTTVNVWSVAKSLSVLALAGVAGFSLSDPVRRWWPELTAGQDLTVAELLSHRGGVVGLRRTVAARELADWPRLIPELERTEPWWQPGDGFGYHSWTFGLLVNELCRRVAGKTVDDLLLAGSVAGQVSFQAPPPAGVARQIRLDVAASPDSARLAGAVGPATWAALRNPALTELDANSSWWRELMLPSVKAYACADGVAGLAAALLPSPAYRLPAEEVAVMLTGAGRGTDRVLGDDREFAPGLVLGHPDSACPYSTTGRLRWGHDGMGGSFFCVDRVAGLVLAWVTNGLGRSINLDPRKLRLLEAFDADTR